MTECEDMAKSDTSCELLTDDEVEIYEVTGSVVDVGVSPNFVAYTSDHRSVHVKVLDTGDVSKPIKTEQMKDSVGKRWKMRVKLCEKNKHKLYLEKLKRSRKLALQRKIRMQNVRKKISTATSSTETTDSSDTNDSMSYYSQVESGNSCGEKRNKSSDGSPSSVEGAKSSVLCSENTDDINTSSVGQNMSENTDTNNIASVSKNICESNDIEDIANNNVSVSCGDDNSKRNEKSEDSNISQTTDAGSEIYYVIGSPIRRPKEDPKQDNLSWFLNAFDRQISMGENSHNDVFECFLLQCDLKSLTPESLRCIVKEYVVQERAAIEPLIKGNLEARNITYNQFVSFLCGTKTSGLDITLKCISVMFRKSIMVIAEDYLWLSHTMPFEEFEVLFVLFKGGHFAAAPYRSGKLVHCEIPEIQKFTIKGNSDSENCGFKHTLMNRSDLGKSNLVQPVPVDTYANCEEEVAGLNATESTVEDLNQADITTTDPNGSTMFVTDADQTTEEAVPKVHADTTVTESVIQVSAKLPVQNCEGISECADDKTSEVPASSKVNPESDTGKLPEMEPSSELESTLNCTTASSSYKETASGADSTLTSEITDEGKRVRIGCCLNPHKGTENSQYIDSILTELKREIFKPVQDRNEIFNSVRPQIMCNRKGRTYTSIHMRLHMNAFIKKNRDEVEDLVGNVLKTRGMSFSDYTEMMEDSTSCGYEATILILARMFQMKILVVRSDFLWLSTNVDPHECDVVLVQSASGYFYGTKGGKKFHVGDVPKFDSATSDLERTVSGNEKPPQFDNNKGISETSTPKTESDKKIFTFELSPIEQRKGVEKSVKIVDDQKIRTKRLGMGGPAQKIRTNEELQSVSVNITDIGKSMCGGATVTVKEDEEKSKIVRFKCTICNAMTFTERGYCHHIFHHHQIRNQDECPPKIISGHDVSLSSSIESLPTMPRPKTYEKEDERKFFCPKCPERFHYAKGVQTHVDHAHKDDASKEIGNIPIVSPELQPDVKCNKKKPKRIKKCPPEMKTLGRRTRSQTRTLLEETDKKQEEEKNDTPNLEKSQDMSKEDFVKSYSLRPRNCPPPVDITKSKVKSSDLNNISTDEINAKDENNENRPTETTLHEQEAQFHEVIPDVAHDEASTVREDISQTENTDDKPCGTGKSENTDIQSAPTENIEEGTMEENEKSENTAVQTHVQYQSNNNDDADETTQTISSVNDDVDDTDKDPNFDASKTDKESDTFISDRDTSEKKKSKKKRKKQDDEKSLEKTKRGRKRKQKEEATTSKKDKGSIHAEVEDNDGDFGYYCDKCNTKFTDWNELQKHKYDCVKFPRKHVCSVCNRGFQQKCLMMQHYDFYHTKKPKKFVCEEHRKVYVYKKSLDEHRRRDHSDGNYRYVCDYCGRGFFHKSEFSIHRESVHLKRKDYLCNRCQEKAFTSVGRLNAHLQICGVSESHACNQCGKSFGSKGNLFTHISDTHKQDLMYTCPICDEKQYNSQGGYYKHLREKHNISRKGIKLTDFVKASKEHNSNDLNISQQSGKENNDNQDSKEEEKEKDEISGKKSRKDSRKRSANDSESDAKPPKKSTRSSGPTTWDCPVCENKKYKSDENYFKHLLNVHSIDPSGNKVHKKNDSKAKDKKK